MGQLFIFITGWWFGTSILFSHILGISSQLTNIFQRGWNHQPVIFISSFKLYMQERLNCHCRQVVVRFVARVAHDADAFRRPMPKASSRRWRENQGECCGGFPARHGGTPIGGCFFVRESLNGWWLGVPPFMEPRLLVYNVKLVLTIPTQLINPRAAGFFLQFKNSWSQQLINRLINQPALWKSFFFTLTFLIEI